MFLHERIDGPIAKRWHKLNSTQLAHSLLWSISTRGSWIHHEDSDEKAPQGYRIGSWVEDENSEFGCAFGLSRTRPHPQDIGQFIISGKFFHVDRETETLTGEPAAVRVDSTRDIHEQTPKLIKTFSKDQMRHAINILNKTPFTLVDAGQGHLDRHVANALVVAHLDPLAEMFPEPGKRT